MMRMHMSRRFLFVLSASLLCLTLPARDVSPKTIVENALVDVVKGITLGEDAESLRGKLIKLAAVDSTNDAVYYYLGICEMALGHDDDAEIVLNEACRLDPSNDDYKETLAHFYGKSGRPDKITEIYLSLLERNPGKYRGAFTLTVKAEDQMSRGQDSLAIANYDAALIYDPGYAPAHVGRAEAYRMRGNMAAFFASARSYTSCSDTDASTKCRYIEEVTKHIDGRTYQVWHAQLDSLVGDCVRAHPSDSGALKLAGRWFYGTGDKDRAQGYFDEYLRLYPECPEAHYIQLSVLYDKGDREGMIRVCKDLISIAGDDKEQIRSAYSTMGECYHELGDNASCYECYDKALEIEPEDVLVLNNYAYFLCLEGKKLKKALKMSRITVDKEPDNATYLDTYGWILHLMGKDKEAKTCFKHAMLYGGKENVEVLSHYAAVLEALGETALATYYNGLAESRR